MKSINNQESVLCCLLDTECMAQASVRHDTGHALLEIIEIINSSDNNDNKLSLRVLHARIVICMQKLQHQTLYNVNVYNHSRCSSLFDPEELCMQFVGTEFHVEYVREKKKKEYNWKPGRYTIMHKNSVAEVYT